MSGKIILSMAYGIDVLPKDDPYVRLAEETNRAVTLIARPDYYLVDALPILKYVPRWFPGAQFQRDAIKYRANSAEFRDAPFRHVKKAMVCATSSPCRCGNDYIYTGGWHSAIFSHV
jgi:hypothetical protein